MDQETIDQATEVLHGLVQTTVQQVGKDVAMALLIHFLHEVSIGALDDRNAA